MAYQIRCGLHRIFIANVKARREELDLTQAEVATKMNIAQGSYAQIESGRNTPTLEVVERVAKALNINYLQLLIPIEVAAISK